MASANTNQNLKNLPVDVISNIIQFLPTKKAIQLCLLSKDWKGLWSSFPVLDFEEGDQVREVFINFLQTCLKFRDNEKSLDIFRLSMKVYSYNDEDRVRNLLRFAVKKRVKELEISLKYQNALFRNTLFNGEPITSLNLENVSTKDGCEPLSLPFLRSMSLKNVNFEGLPFNKLMHGVKSLITLKLERLKLDACTFSGPSISFPSLRTMSFQHVHLKTDLHFLEDGCPSLECLSFSDCSGYDGSTLSVLQVANSSLKFLEITNCNVKGVQVFRSTNLKSFSLVSESPHLQKVGLYCCESLTCLNIHQPHLKELVLYGCGDSVEATLNTPSLFEFTFRGYLDCAVPLRAPNLFIVLIELWDKEPGFGGVLEHYTALRAYLEIFDCCSENIFIGVHDVETLIFPESFRDTCPAPLPSLKRIKVFVKLHQEASESDLKDSLSWLAPSADILPVVYDESQYLWYSHKQKLIKGSGFS